MNRLISASRLPFLDPTRILLTRQLTPTFPIRFKHALATPTSQKGKISSAKSGKISLKNKQVLKKGKSKIVEKKKVTIQQTKKGLKIQEKLTIKSKPVEKQKEAERSKKEDKENKKESKKETKKETTKGGKHETKGKEVEKEDKKEAKGKKEVDTKVERKHVKQDVPKAATGSTKQQAKVVEEPEEEITEEDIEEMLEEGVEDEVQEVQKEAPTTRGRKSTKAGTSSVDKGIKEEKSKKVDQKKELEAQEQDGNTDNQYTQVQLIRKNQPIGTPSIKGGEQLDKFKSQGKTVQRELWKLIGLDYSNYSTTVDPVKQQISKTINYFFSARRQRSQHAVSKDPSHYASVLGALNTAQFHEAMKVFCWKVVIPDGALNSFQCDLLYPIVSFVQAKQLFEAIQQLEHITYHHVHAYMRALLRFVGSGEPMLNELDAAVEALRGVNRQPTGLTYAIYIQYHLLMNEEEKAQKKLAEAQAQDLFGQTTSLEQLKIASTMRASNENIDWLTPFMERKVHFVDSMKIYNEASSGLVANSRFFTEHSAELYLEYTFKNVLVQENILQKYRRVVASQVKLNNLFALQGTPVKMEVDNEGVPLDSILTDWIKRSIAVYEQNPSSYIQAAKEYKYQEIDYE